MNKLLMIALLLGASVPAMAKDMPIPEKVPPAAQRIPEPAPAPVATLEGVAPVKAGMPESLTINLVDAKGLPLGEDRLQTIHTKKLHLLIVDESLTDYQHVHPESAEKPGSYSFSFTPKTGHDYRIWANFAPNDEHESYIKTADLKGTVPCAAPCVDTTVSNTATQDGYVFRLSFDQKLKAGVPDMGNFMINDSSGKPVATLQPVLGAYAHIVAFDAGGKGVTHVHPMGDEPKSASDRGQSPLMFHIEPEQAGFVKIFAQVNIDGKEMFVPFGQTVETGSEDPSKLIAHQ